MSGERWSIRSRWVENESLSFEWFTGSRLLRMCSHPAPFFCMPSTASTGTSLERSEPARSTKEKRKYLIPRRLPSVAKQMSEDPVENLATETFFTRWAHGSTLGPRARERLRRADNMVPAGSL